MKLFYFEMTKQIIISFLEETNYLRRQNRINEVTLLSGRVHIIYPNIYIFLYYINKLNPLGCTGLTQSGKLAPKRLPSPHTSQCIYLILMMQQ